MKKILITGKNSYIGCAVEKWLEQWPTEYKVDTLDMMDKQWHDYDFSQYDVVYHVAGIAHVSNDSKLDDLYYMVNRDLAIETAEKAKRENVKQFIFMSSAILYGIDSRIGEEVVISTDTVPHPFNAYGISKKEADEKIQSMTCDKFHTVCIRTPMVYGANCKGNFALLKKYSNKLLILPKIENKRSMIHIENLAQFVKQRIDTGDSGVFYPQNAEYVATNDIVSTIRKINGKRTNYSLLLGKIVVGCSRFIPMFRKIYGNIEYSKSISETSYIVNDFETSIRKSM